MLRFLIGKDVDELYEQIEEMQEEISFWKNLNDNSPECKIGNYCTHCQYGYSFVDGEKIKIVYGCKLKIPCKNFMEVKR